jgi:hypothetical protein
LRRCSGISSAAPGARWCRLINPSAGRSARGWLSAVGARGSGACLSIYSRGALLYDRHNNKPVCLSSVRTCRFFLFGFDRPNWKDKDKGHPRARVLSIYTRGLQKKTKKTSNNKQQQKPGEISKKQPTDFPFLFFPCFLAG